MRAMRALRATPVSAARPEVLVEHCDFCKTELDEDHRHMLDLSERAILCVCEPCMAMKAGMDQLRPVGSRVLRLEDFELPEHVWAAFSIPVGLAFFLRSSGVGRVAALYPSPAGATECELEFSSWEALVDLNPVLLSLETDVEALIVDRISEPPAYAIVPIDECYKLVGMIKVRWQGISGGDAISQALGAFFEELRERGRT
jgi:hypothetical protein